jgi:transcriptional regulator with XRE-family HTH domain
MVDERLGKKIQFFREKAGISQDELAAHVGVSVTSISNIERGANYPSFENFIKILNYIKASPNQVMFDIVDNAQISKASELWDRIKKLDNAKRQKLFRIVQIFLEDEN